MDSSIVVGEYEIIFKENDLVSPTTILLSEGCSESPVPDLEAD